MPTSFPAAIDTFTNPVAGDTMSAVPHHTQHANANDAISALEAKVGVDGSAVHASLDYRVAALEGKTHVQEIPSGALNGSNAAFALTWAPNPAAALMLFLNGLLQRPGGNDFTLSGTTVTFGQAPAATDSILAHYIV